MKDVPALPKDTSLRSLTPLDYGVLKLSFQMVRAVIFDLDGTLIDYKYHAEEAREAMIASLGNLGFDVSKMDAKAPTMMIVDSALRQIGGGKVRIGKEELRQMLNETLDGFDMRAQSEAAIKPHSVRVIKEIKAKGYLLGLVTNSGSKVTTLSLEKYQIANYFDAVVTRDDVERMKPSGEGLRRILEFLHVDASEAVYVGDSWADVVAARENGVRNIAVEGGMSTRERLEEQSPELILPSLEKLPSLLPVLSSRDN
jgi:HAD superfamily hydrolase (TIGR01549 family)